MIIFRHKLFSVIGVDKVKFTTPPQKIVSMPSPMNQAPKNTIKTDIQEAKTRFNQEMANKQAQLQKQQENLAKEKQKLDDQKKLLTQQKLITYENKTSTNILL